MRTISYAWTIERVCVKEYFFQEFHLFRLNCKVKGPRYMKGQNKQGGNHPNTFEKHRVRRTLMKIKVNVGSEQKK